MTDEQRKRRDDQASEYGKTFTIRDPRESDGIHQLLCEAKAADFRSGFHAGFAEGAKEVERLTDLADETGASRFYNYWMEAAKDRDFWKAECEKLKLALEFYGTFQNFSHCSVDGDPEVADPEFSNWMSGEGEYDIEDGLVARAAVASYEQAKKGREL